MLGERIHEHKTAVWLINTGWSGGAQGEGGERIRLAHTRAMVRAALSGALEGVPASADPVMGTWQDYGWGELSHDLGHPGDVPFSDIPYSGQSCNNADY